MDIKSDMREIESNQQTIIGEISDIQKNFVEVLRTLEKSTKSVEKTDKARSPPAIDGHPEKVTCYFTDFVLYRFCYFTYYVTLQIMII